ncbi:hypothetical protein QMP26_08740 [Enterocloster clostridioformis]
MGNQKPLTELHHRRVAVEQQYVAPLYFLKIIFSVVKPKKDYRILSAALFISRAALL